MEEKKRIRFIDSHYHTLFSIADGDSIEIVYPDGKREERVCTYIDEYHTQVGARVFHICEFAEIMEANGKSYCPAECKEKEERKEAVKGEKKTGTIRMVLWSSIFVTLMANKIGGLQFGIYRNCQISSRVFHTAVAALPLTKANRSDFE